MRQKQPLTDLLVGQSVSGDLALRVLRRTSPKTDSGVDQRGEAVEFGDAGVKHCLCVAWRYRLEDVSSAKFSLPSAYPVHVLFFLVQFGECELLVADLLCQLGQALAALRLELGPLRQSGFVVHAAYLCAGCLIDRRGAKRGYLPLVLRHQIDDSFDDVSRDGSFWQRPAALAQLSGTHAP